MNKKKLILWIIIGILAILVIYVTFFIKPASSTVISSAGQAAKTASSGMVGGC